MSLTELSAAARLYLLAHARNDADVAAALAEIVFLGRPARRVALERGMRARTLHRRAVRLRRELRGAVALVGASAFVASDDASRDAS